MLKIIKGEKKIQILDNGIFISEIPNDFKIKKSNYPMYSSIVENLDFIPPIFGITALGNSHGFDACDSTSGFILWV